MASLFIQFLKCFLVRFFSRLIVALTEATIVSICVKIISCDRISMLFSYNKQESNDYRCVFLRFSRVIKR